MNNERRGLAVHIPAQAPFACGPFFLRAEVGSSIPLCSCFRVALVPRRQTCCLYLLFLHNTHVFQWLRHMKWQRVVKHYMTFIIYFSWRTTERGGMYPFSLEVKSWRRSVATDCLDLKYALAYVKNIYVQSTTSAFSNGMILE